MRAVQLPIGHYVNRFGRARLHRLRKNSRNHALPWKSGASAPRKQFEINERFSAWATEMDPQRLLSDPVQPCRYAPNENTNFSPWNRALRRKLLLSLVLITLVFLFPTPSHAYAGPGAGFAVLSSFWTLFV